MHTARLLKASYNVVALEHFGCEIFPYKSCIMYGSYQ